jgi:hypothetical protein
MIGVGNSGWIVFAIVSFFSNPRCQPLFALEQLSSIRSSPNLVSFR